MNILGLNAYHGDSAACLVVDGRLAAAAEEERFRRIKHWAGVPSYSVRYCLESAGVRPEQVDAIAINRDPRAHLGRKAVYAATHRPGAALVAARLKNALKVVDVRRHLEADLGLPQGAFRAPVSHVEHHRAHLASAFFVSPFERAAAVSVDGFGDFASACWGEGDGNRLRVRASVFFPHSLGLFYLAVTQYLGFPAYGDEYKVMGLAPYGEPRFLETMREIVRLVPGGGYRLDLSCFLHHAQGVSMVWENGEPALGEAFSPELERRLGPRRRKDEPIDDRHRDVAASAQAMYEEAFFHLLRAVQAKVGRQELCLAGGCAMNSVANGRIYEHTPFRRLYVQSAAGDAGGAIGAAYYVWNAVWGRPRTFVMDHAYWGPSFDDAKIKEVLRARARELDASGCTLETFAEPKALCEAVAADIASGKVVGWFQGRMEWGPRALGNRSILGDPRRADMKDVLNLKIKRRESFRPFAPSVLREAAGAWFDVDDDVPFMTQVYPVRPEKRRLVPAVTHVNGSGRLQTVTAAQNPLYHALIEAFARSTGVPMLLNTSFNENEPIVLAPGEALECFLRTDMDVLVLGANRIERKR